MSNATMRERRRALGLTIDDVATGADASVSHVSLIERGARSPSPDLAARIESVFRAAEDRLRAERIGRVVLDIAREVAATDAVTLADDSGVGR